MHSVLLFDVTFKWSRWKLISIAFYKSPADAAMSGCVLRALLVYHVSDLDWNFEGSMNILEFIFLLLPQFNGVKLVVVDIESFVWRLEALDSTYGTYGTINVF